MKLNSVVIRNNESPVSGFILTKIPTLFGPKRYRYQFGGTVGKITFGSTLNHKTTDGSVRTSMVDGDMWFWVFLPNDPRNYLHIIKKDGTILMNQPH